MNELIIIGIICVVGIVVYYLDEHGLQLIRFVKDIIKWNIERFKEEP